MNAEAGSRVSLVADGRVSNLYTNVGESFYRLKARGGRGLSKEPADLIILLCLRTAAEVYPGYATAHSTSAW